MNRYETIWSFNTKRFNVSLAYDYDEAVDLSWDDTGEVRAKLESGEWCAYVFRVSVMCDGREVGADYLHGSIYADPREFRDHVGLKIKSRADGCTYGSYFVDMMHEAIGEARKALCNTPKLRCA